MRKEDFKILYEKYLLDQCSEEELQALMSYFSQLQDSEELTDVASLLQKEKREITLPSEKSEAILKHILHRKRPNRPIQKLFPYLKYMAAACLLLAGFIFFKQQQTAPSPVHVVFKNDSQQIKKIRLQDGTAIYVKPHTQITQQTNFDTDTLRIIHLTGEAFFAIAHNPQKPFIVKTDNRFHVRVLGTRFNLKSTEKAQEVVLTQGSVALNSGTENITLKPSERAVYLADLQRFETSSVDTLHYISWTNNELYFADTRLEDIMEQLNTNYADEAKTLSIPHKARNLQFTGYLPTNNLDKCIKILNKTFANHQIIITKE